MHDRLPTRSFLSLNRRKILWGKEKRKGERCAPDCSLSPCVSWMEGEGKGRKNREEEERGEKGALRSSVSPMLVKKRNRKERGGEKPADFCLQLHLISMTYDSQERRYEGKEEKREGGKGILDRTELLSTEEDEGEKKR